MRKGILHRVVLVAVLALVFVPSVARASTITLGWVFFQEVVSPGDEPGAVGINAFYLQWDPLVTDPGALVTGAGFAVQGEMDQVAFDWSNPALGAAPSQIEPLAGWGFASTATLSGAQFWADLGEGVLQLDGLSYRVAAQTLQAQFTSGPLVPFPYNLEGTEWVTLEAEATPLEVPIPEPATLALTAGGVVLAMARRRFARRA